VTHDLARPLAHSEISRKGLFAFLLKAARPGFWITSVWFYLLPLGGRNLFDSYGFWLGLIYVTFPLGLFIYGWNDCVDAETDRLNPRKDSYLFGARGTQAQLARLPWWIAAVQVPFFVLFVGEIGLARTIAYFAALTLATWLYNNPGGGAKTQPGFDLLNQVAYLLVFILCSWLNDVPQLPWYTFVFGAMFAMHSHLFGEVMDLEPDRAAGRRTTALVLGPIRSKGILAAMLMAEGVLVFATTADTLIAGALAFGSLWFVTDALFLWRERPYSPCQARLFFLGWNAAAMVTAPIIWKIATLAH
jgi:4-hydroxybenzoate polyprenyltransferase